MTTDGLTPGCPLFPRDQPIEDCIWLASLTDAELTYWPRRNVCATPLVYPQIPCAGACGGVYIHMLCLN